MGDAETGPDPTDARPARTDADVAVAALRAVCLGPVLDPHGVDAFVELAGRRRDGLDRRVVVLGAVDTDDVVHALEWAAEHGAQVAVPGSGHVGSSDRPTVVVTRARIDAVVVEADAGRVHVGVGATWTAIRAAAAAHGLAVDVPDLPLPVADAHTGAFLGILRAAPVRALTLVTGDGVVHRVDPDTEPDLWWTLTRGSDLAGVLTGVELELDPAPRPRRSTEGSVTAAAAPAAPRPGTGWSAEDEERLAAIARRHDPAGVLG